MRIDAQDKLGSLSIPTVQVLGVAEIGVAAKGHAAGHGLHQRDRPIHPFHTPALAGRVARTIDHIEHLLGVGQTHHQGRITPDPFVGDVHPLLALPIGACDRPIHVHKGFLEKSCRLHLPNRQPRPIDTLLQHGDILRPEAPGEISRRRRVRNSFGSQPVHEHFVLSSQFNVFQALTAC